MNTVYQIALVTHIVGLSVLAGTTLADFVLYKQFWKYLSLDRLQGIGINNAVSRLRILFGIGILLLILSGVTMMAITQGAFGEQVWFRIKFALVLIIIFNGVLVGRRQGVKLSKMLSTAVAPDNALGLLKIKGSLRVYHISQLILFTVVFVLSVFKFN